jgi:hypothetical protein
MSEPNYEAPLEPANEPENADWVVEYPSDDEYTVQVSELERQEQLDQFKAAVDERVRPLAEWAEGQELERREVEGLAKAEEMVKEIGQKHGADLDFKTIYAEANSWFQENHGAIVNHFIQSGIPPAQAEELVNNEGAVAILDWFAKQATSKGGDEMSVIGRYMGQNVGGGPPAPSRTRGDEMSVVRKHFPKG